ncbi:MAG: hypothetical protein P1P77_12910 [Spirochaetaceae bacterium]|nr:hypothetical protein [Spirochaetaceae bacterium]
MKKLLFVSVFVLLVSTLWAEYLPYGFGLSGRYYHRKLVNVADTEFTTDSIYIQPHISAMVDDNIEARVFGYFSVETDKTDGTKTDKNIEYGGGFGAYYHLLQSELFHMGAGVLVSAGYQADTFPSGTDDDQFVYGLDVPVFVDCIVHPNVVLRVELSTFAIDGSYDKRDDGTKDNFIDFLAGANPRIGVTYRF